MTVTVIRNKSLGASRNRAAFYPPASLGLKALFLPGGGDLTEQILYGKRNFAPRGVSPVWSGIPGYHDDYLSLDNGRTLTVDGVSEPESASFLWVGKVTETDLANTSKRPHLVGWGGDGQGAMIAATSATQYRLLGIVDASIVGPALTADLSSVQMIAGRIEAGVGMKIFNLTAGTSATTVATGTRGMGSGARSLHIGGPANGGTLTTAGGHDTHMAMAWDRALNDDEIAQMAEWARSLQSDLTGAPVTW